MTIQKTVSQWEMDWIYRNRYPRAEQRARLANQLRTIRRVCGNNAMAMGFLHHLLWVGVYPSKRRV